MSAKQYFHISLEVWGALFCLVAAIIMWIGRKDQKDKLVIYMELTTVGMLVADAFAWGFRGYQGITGYYMVRISNLLVFVLEYVLEILFTTYTVALIDGKNDFPVNTWLWAVVMVGLLGIALNVGNLFTQTFYYYDAHNFYHRTSLHYLLMIIGFVNIVLDLMLLLINRAYYEMQLFWSLMSYLLLPVLTGVYQIFHYGFSLINIAVAFSMIFIFLVWMVDRTHQQLEQEKQLLEQQNHIMEQEKEIAAMQQDIMLSQIQPHFLYNSLTAIAQLCEKEPKEAKKVTVAFADYLRTNMNALKTKEPVPFVQELEHVQNYLQIEQMRFGEQLEVIFDIETVEFCVPVLTVQPIVENAIKHGIHRNGTVVIRTTEEKEWYKITVEDDGVGFDPDHIVTEDGRQHVGIQNVRHRIENMCQGSLMYISKPGEGTMAIIRIPKK